MDTKYVTVPIEENLLDKIKEFYFEHLTSTDADYALFEIDHENFHAICYQNKKGDISLVFSGELALREARRWYPDAEYNPKKTKINYEYLDLRDQIGSDEVGVGDLLLPMIVVAIRATTEQIAKAMELGIKDSKKLSEVKIRELGPKLINLVKYSKLLLPNSKYNEQLEKGDNLNSMKAKMHNRALLNMHKDFNEYPIYVDQFCSEEKYYEYIEKENEKLNYINFACKGEQLYPSVAIASIIARYAFLLEKDRLEKELNIKIPLGAGKDADNFVSNYLKNHNKEQLKNLVKANFENFRKLD